VNDPNGPNASNEPNGHEEPTLVERWLQDQQQWQRTLFTYLDSMMKNDEFLMHMGNAMRGSLLAGKPYPTAAPPPTTTPTTQPADETATADRLDKVLFALRQLQGQVQDVLMTLDEMRGLPPVASAKAGIRTTPKAIRLKPNSTAGKIKKPARAKRTASGARKTGRRRTRS
jgi:hypothetical protein